MDYMEKRLRLEFLTSAPENGAAEVNTYMDATVLSYKTCPQTSHPTPFHSIHIFELLACRQMSPFVYLPNSLSNQ
jgi:hypothetical protein